MSGETTAWFLAGIGAVTTTLAAAVAKLYQTNEMHNKERIERLEMIVQSQSNRLEKHREEYTLLLKTNAELMAKISSLETMVDILKGEFGEAIKLYAETAATARDIQDEIGRINSNNN